MHETTGYWLRTIQDLVEKQAADDGLWFEAQTAPEAYLQQELRRLHEVIERDPILPWAGLPKYPTHTDP